jgi:hypothetical protein
MFIDVSNNPRSSGNEQALFKKMNVFRGDIIVKENQIGESQRPFMKIETPFLDMTRGSMEREIFWLVLFYLPQCPQDYPRILSRVVFNV